MVLYQKLGFYVVPIRIRIKYLLILTYFIIFILMNYYPRMLPVKVVANRITIGGSNQQINFFILVYLLKNLFWSIYFVQISPKNDSKTEQNYTITLILYQFHCKICYFFILGFPSKIFLVTCFTSLGVVFAIFVNSISQFDYNFWCNLMRF